MCPEDCQCGSRFWQAHSHINPRTVCVWLLSFSTTLARRTPCAHHRGEARLPQDTRAERGRAQGEFLSVPVTVYVCVHLLISGYFLCTDLEAGCRGQGRNSCWVVKSTKPLLQASESPPDSRSCSTGWQASLQMPTQWLALLRGIFKNRLCFGLFRTIKKPVWNHRTSMFLVLLKLTKKN